MLHLSFMVHQLKSSAKSSATRYKTKQTFFSHLYKFRSSGQNKSIGFNKNFYSFLDLSTYCKTRMCKKPAFSETIVEMRQIQAHKMQKIKSIQIFLGGLSQKNTTFNVKMLFFYIRKSKTKEKRLKFESIVLPRQIKIQIIL